MKERVKKFLGRGKLTVLAVVVALTVGIASTALAANGGNFILGVLSNSATAITQLTANIANPALKLVNTNTSTGATALNLQTATSKPPMTVNSKTKVANLNADTVDGKDSTALGVTTKSAHILTGSCTTPGVFSACAPVTVKVPTGKQYHVTVLSSLDAMSPEGGGVRYCPAIQGGSFGLSCIDTGTGATALADLLLFAPGDTKSAATSGEIGPLPAGTYTFSTTINADTALLADPQFKAHTTVLVRDASAPGPPIG